MSIPPEYFERIREDALKRWDQLEENLDLAGPWHQREPLMLDAEAPGKINQSHNTCAFILSDLEGEPIELDGHHLKNMFEEDMIKLYPATYRIVYEHDN